MKKISIMFVGAVSLAPAGCGGVASDIGDLELVSEASEGVEAGPCNGPLQPKPAPCTPACPVVYCGGELWNGGVVPYRILSTAVTCDDVLTHWFSIDDKIRIRGAADAWTTKSNHLVRFSECANGDCDAEGHSRYLTVQPGCGGSGGNPTFMIPGADTTHFLHEFGHTIGLGHMFWRADRDRFIRLSTDICPTNGVYAEMWKCQTPIPDDPFFPGITTGAFGPYDEASVMNYGSADICEDNGIEPGSTETPTSGDGSALTELYNIPNGWAPFVSTGDDINPLAPLSYQLVPGVVMRGSAAIESFSYPGLEIFARGTNNRIYRRFKNIVNGVWAGWSGWESVGFDFDADPAVVTPSSTELFLFGRRTDDNIHVRKLSISSGWGEWQSIGAPSGGAASAPAVASWASNRIDVFVRGNNDRLYQRPAPARLGARPGPSSARARSRASQPLSLAEVRRSTSSSTAWTTSFGPSDMTPAGKTSFPSALASLTLQEKPPCRRSPLGVRIVSMSSTGGEMVICRSSSGAAEAGTAPTASVDTWREVRPRSEPFELRTA